MNQMKEIDEILKEIIKTQLNNEDLIITSDTNLISDLGMESISLMRFVIEIEERLEIELPDDFFTLEKLSNYKAMTELLSNLLKSKNINIFDNN